MTPGLLSRKRAPEKKPTDVLRPPFVRVGREVVKEAGQTVRTERKTRDAQAREQDLANEQELKRAERIRRLERFVSRLEPEKREMVQKFLEQTIEAIQRAQQQGMHPKMLKDRLQARLKWFFDQPDMYPDSPINIQRVRIVMRYFKASDII